MTKRPIQKQSGESPEDTCTMLIEDPSRGFYVSKKKLELLPKRSPRLFAPKLFELMFNREREKGREKGRETLSWTPTKLLFFLSTTAEKNRVLIAENIGHIKADKENARLLENSVRDVAKETILQSVAKASKKLN